MRILSSFIASCVLTLSAFSQTCIWADYQLNGNTNDASGNNYNGVAVNGPLSTNGMAGSANTAYLFDAVDDYITLNNDQPILQTGSFSISIKARVDGPGGGTFQQNMMFQQRDDNTSPAESIVVFNQRNLTDNVAFIVKSPNQSSITKIEYPSPMDGLWHCYTAVFDSVNGMMSSYLDGQLMVSGSTPSNGTYNVSIDYVSIGRHAYSGGTKDLFNGAIDEVTIYDCVLASAEVVQLCDTTSTGVKEQAKFTSKVFPNPVKDVLNVQGISGSNQQLRIYNMMGQIVKNEVCNSGVGVIMLDVSQLKTGIYFCEIIGGEKKEVVKLVKE